MKDKIPWFEDDVLWEKIGPYIFSTARLDMAPEEVDQLLELTNLAPGSDVLDLCCGVGRHSIELARRGYSVTAVDRTRLYLDKASESAQDAGVEVEFVKSDMREFCRPDSFDMVICMFTSFGYFENPQDDLRVIENVASSLKKGGCFAVESMGKEIIARIYLPNNWEEEEDGTLFLERRRVTKDWSWMENQWIIIDGTDRFEMDFSHRIFAATELETLLTNHGFAAAEAYGGVDGSTYDQNAKRMLIIGRK